jgi:hypothetical protein
MYKKTQKTIMEWCLLFVVLEWHLQRNRAWYFMTKFTAAQHVLVVTRFCREREEAGHTIETSWRFFETEAR